MLLKINENNLIYQAIHRNLNGEFHFQLNFEDRINRNVN